MNKYVQSWLNHASAGTVYPVLQQLEDEGLVRSKEADGKKVFELTDAGHSELGAHVEAVERIWQRAGRWREWGCRMGPDTIEVASAVGRLTKAALSHARDDKKTERVLKILNRARSDLKAV